MAGETVITIVGNLTADPELRTTRDGGAVANFSIAATPRVYDRQSQQWVDGDVLFLRCTAWRDLAEHCANSLAKGMRVIAQGRLQQRSYQAQDGSQRTVIELQVDEIGPSLRYATAQVTRADSQRSTRPRPTGQREDAPATDPWAADRATLSGAGRFAADRPATDPWSDADGEF
ncbi:single-stranded DNA-binding protein [Bifidobacterium breve]|uniref:Single-stranded DNA-binding protein n=1 Tax=Bifidobacterium breve TaxID=1685 RepID=A0A2K9BU03_BIFBR|nr:single-stranded DNA-binding protein [Bifidobacterium breve]AUE03576.1 Single-strand DNA-binding protein [Bifidobacterium breve]AUE05616.1 Single-strand DNA-binding protein [Bifidobacterium breve]AUE21039.1 Single-strand DNA-binding protein [Bifidobacterium breve]